MRVQGGWGAGLLSSDFQCQITISALLEKTRINCLWGVNLHNFIEFRFGNYKFDIRFVERRRVAFDAIWGHLILVSYLLLLFFLFLFFSFSSSSHAFVVASSPS